jgi:AhpD family alkylhydroperoxidase
MCRSVFLMKRDRCGRVTHRNDNIISSPRIDHTVHAASACQALAKLSYQLHHHGSLDHTLVALIDQRVSQLNGCTFCLDMHGTTLRKLGVDPRKLDTLAGWDESPFFDESERAALAWAESLTNVGTTRAPDAVYQALLPYFNETQIAELTYAVALINAWNRIAVGLRSQLP